MTEALENDRPLMIMDPRDNVAVCLRPLAAGEEILLAHGGRTHSILVREAVPLGHKVSLAAIAKGQAITRYGEIIGRATAEIPAGLHVHTQNISDY